MTYKTIRIPATASQNGEQETIRIENKEAESQELHNQEPENRELKYLLASCSDIGISRKVNQDACCARIFRTQLHTVVLAAVCDGVGGMEEGEYASKSTIQALNNWFDYRLDKLVLEEGKDDLISILSEEIKDVIERQHQTILAYSREKAIKTGTTLTAMLFVDYNYFIVQIGDSRAYCVKDGLIQLTEDQSLVAMEIKEGRLTEEQARIDKRRNIILQCIGASKDLIPVYQRGTILSGASYFLCSDGFVHQFSRDELEVAMHPDEQDDINSMHSRLLKNIEAVKARGEKDNITVVWIRIM